MKRTRYGFLGESSIARMFAHWMGGGFAGITAWRGPSSPAANRKNLRALKKDIRAAGFGFVPVLGSYQEKGMPKPDWEPSIIVPAMQMDTKVPDPMRLRKLIVKLGQKYDQDSVLFVFPSDDDTPAAELIQTRDTDDATGKRSNVSKVVQHFSRFRAGDHFMAMTYTGREGIAAHRALAKGKAVTKAPTHPAFAAESTKPKPIGRLLRET